ncbi:SPOR domain-containing protein [uncultured Imperialibacter sp.]|uniref:SPOR domain-containing protein n=1 Tax=uncultured Imperialibacter sp. TaxID=1672639 RepID=UPI0030D98624|tara:strand:+ start:7981 stop:8490 length:510 start_codon:yes stop_codon:yes gene_type:complete
MNRVVSLALGVFILYGCSKKVVPSSGTTDSYSEDLSILHPVITTDESPLKPTETSKSPISSEPLKTQYDITQELDSVVMFIAEKNLQKRVIDGFTVQVYSGPNRDQANNARAQLHSIGLDIPSQVVYVQPNFKVKIGKFYSRLEANQVYAQVREVFPNALLLPEKIPVE